MFSAFSQTKRKSQFGAEGILGTLRILSSETKKSGVCLSPSFASSEKKLGRASPPFRPLAPPLGAPPAGPEAGMVGTEAESKAAHASLLPGRALAGRKERAHSGRLGVWRRMRRSERLVEHESPRSCHQHTEATRALGAEGALRSGCLFCVAALQAAPAAGRRRRPNKRGPQHRAKARYMMMDMTS